MSSMPTLSLLLNARFNRDIAEDASFYWTKVAKYLEALIDRNDIISAEKVDILSACAKARIKNAYSCSLLRINMQMRFMQNFC